MELWSRADEVANANESGIVASGPLERAVRIADSTSAMVGCVGGAVKREGWRKEVVDRLLWIAGALCLFGGRCPTFCPPLLVGNIYVGTRYKIYGGKFCIRVCTRNRWPKSGIWARVPSQPSEFGGRAPGPAIGKSLVSTNPKSRKAKAMRSYWYSSQRAEWHTRANGTFKCPIF